MKRRLYWCETEDHDEDWFVVATTAKQAREFFSGYEGYDDPDLVVATYLHPVPEEFKWMCRGHTTGVPNYADEEILIACGGKIIQKESPVVVELQGKLYREGMLQSMIDRIQQPQHEN